MRKYGFILVIALIMLVDFMVLEGVRSNRSGEPDAVVVLTERELTLDAFKAMNKKDNTGIFLRLNWNQYPLYGKLFSGLGANKQYDWFDHAKLEDAGFDCTMPLTSPDAAVHYEKMLPRKAYVVLEYEGKAWDELMEQAWSRLLAIVERDQNGAATEQYMKDAAEEYEHMQNAGSRLIAVDVGRDPAVLRQRYPDQGHYLILAAKVRVHYARPYGNEAEKKEPIKLKGYVETILIDSIHVSKPESSMLEALALKTGRDAGQVNSYTGMYQKDPSYKVTLHFGNRFEPWVAGVESLLVSP